MGNVPGEPGMSTTGPWHEGFAVTTVVLGSYVTIVACNPDVADAIADLLGSPHQRLPAQPAVVSRLVRSPVLAAQKSSMEQWSLLGSTRRRIPAL